MDQAAASSLAISFRALMALTEFSNAFSKTLQADASVDGNSTKTGNYEKMLTLHSNRVNPGSLWATAKAVKPS